MVKEITNVYQPGQMTSTAKFSDFTDADILQLSFGKRGRKKELALAGITYLVNEISIEQQVLKTGYMTNVLYNAELNDPFVLSTLKSYEQLVSLLSVFGRVDDINVSFLDFLQSTPPGSFGLDSNFVFDESFLNPNAFEQVPKLRKTRESVKKLCENVEKRLSNSVYPTPSAFFQERCC